MIDERDFFDVRNNCKLCGDRIFSIYDKWKEARVSHLLLFHSLEERLRFKEEEKRCQKSA
jgi:hypothetical protein